jgi:hypothetical protein
MLWRNDDRPALLVKPTLSTASTLSRQTMASLLGLRRIIVTTKKTFAIS